jgi:ankyrin repeat protein
MTTPDESGQLPLHRALRDNVTLGSIKLLVNGNLSALDVMDREGNSPLHYACHGAKHNTIALLLEKYGAASVSKRNERNKLPIDLLLESDGVSDRESIEYTDSIYRLMRAYPETLMLMIESTIPSVVKRRTSLEFLRREKCNKKSRKGFRTCHSH